MIDSKTLNHLLRNPKQMMDFQATGKIPQLAEPKSPLITLLQSINPNERRMITSVRIGQGLGYTSNKLFQNAAQALTWLKPGYSAASYPSESHQDKRFAKVLTIDDLASCAKVPDSIKEAWWRQHPEMRRAKPLTRSDESTPGTF
jgi:hypothetical protein